MVDWKEQPLALYAWAIVLSGTSVVAAACLIAAGPLPLLVAATSLCLMVALGGAVAVGLTLATGKDVVRAAVIGAGMLSLSAVLIPLAVTDTSDPVCKTQDCDLGPSLGGAAFFGITSLVFYLLIGTGYLLRKWLASRHSS